MQQGRGRPSDDPPISKDPEVLIVSYAIAERKAFLALSPQAQEETRARVRLILAEASQRRTRPSPLARTARYVYAIEVAWVSAEFEIFPAES